MGQYFLTVNLTKGEFLDPHKLGLGLKAREQTGAFAGTTGDILLMLIGTNAGRGGGDFIVPSQPNYGDPNFSEKHRLAMEAGKEVYGRWAGDLVCFVGDYTEDTDMPNVEHASKIYSATRTWEDYRKDGLPANIEKWVDSRHKQYEGKETPERIKGWKDDEILHLTKFNLHDITDLVLPYVELNFGVRVKADSHGWREREIVDPDIC